MRFLPEMSGRRVAGRGGVYKKERPFGAGPHHPGPLLPASHAPFREKREELEAEKRGLLSLSSLLSLQSLFFSLFSRPEGGEAGRRGPG